MPRHLARSPIVLAACAAALAACAHGTRVTTIPSVQGRDVGRVVPDWYVNPVHDDKTVVATGSATSADMQLALTKAQTVARAALAEEMDATYNVLTRQFAEEVGRDSTGQLLDQFTRTVEGVVHQTLVNSTPSRQHLQEEPGGYRAFVLIAVARTDLAARLVREIKTNEALYTRLRATQAFKDLEKAIPPSPMP
jgi:hypothetical protein